MNFGTKLRTVLAIATSLNTALMATDLTGFHNGAVDTVYKVVSIILNFVVVACVTYYNNDYTKEACLGTGLTRQLKAEKKPDYVGEVFFESGEGELDDDESDL